MIKHLLAWWKNILSSAFISAFIVTALEGIVGNRADTLFTLVWSSVQAIVIANLLFWFIVLPVLLVCIGICMYFRRRSQFLEHARSIDHKILRLDDLLLLGLASWVPLPNIEEEKKRIITDILLGAIAEFDGHVHRAALLLPDASGDYLYCWTNYQMPQDSIDNMKFYIGADQSRRQRESGVAGEVFLTRELQVGHLRQVNGIWICEDCPNYMKFSGRRPFPPYLSFVNIPIISTDPNTLNPSATTCLGVICFDSPHKDSFDSKENQDILRTLSRRIAAALLIFKLYQNPSFPPTQGNNNP